MKARTAQIASGLTLAGTFLLDYLAPLGCQEYLLYTVSILLAARQGNPKSVHVVAGLATGLVVAGWALSPSEVHPAPAILNRTLSVALLWVVAVLVNRGRAVTIDQGVQQLAALVDSSVDAIISQDCHGAVTSWNPAAERMFGYRAAERIGHSLRALILSDRVVRDADLGQRIMQGEAISQYETAWQHRDGHRIELSLSLSPIRNQVGAVVGLSTIAHDITSHNATMRVLREQEARLNLVVSATQTGVWDWNLKTNEMYYSPLWKQSLGYGADELSTSPAEWETRLHQDDRERVFALVAEFHEGKIPTYELEHRLRHRDGTYRWIHTDAVLIRDEQGVPIRMTGSHVDVTERKCDQEALRLNEERFRRYFELGLIGMAKTSLDKHWIEFNDQLCRILGYSREELTRLTWTDLTHPDDLAADLAQFQLVLDGQSQGYSMEKRFLHKSGTVVYAVISANAIRKHDGSIDHFVALVHDITPWRQAEISLKQSEVTLQTFFDSASLMMGVVEVLDDDIRHLSDNQATARLFGTTPEAMRERTASALGVPEDLRQMWLTHYRICIQSGVPVRFEYEHVAGPDGKGRRLSFLATVSFIGVGPTGYPRCSYIVDDVTESRQAEALLRQAHDLLEQRVAERTVELASATVRARVLAQRLFEVQEAERRAVAQDLHDEIGQQLTALKMNLQQVQRDGEGVRPQAELDESIAISDQLLARVRNLALDLRPSLLDDLGLVPALRWYATRQAERAGWSIQLHLDEGPLSLAVPRSIACFRVVQEALTNVARHAKAGSVRISLLADQDQIRIAVQDDGHGFDVGATQARSHRGMSMGLLGMEERVRLAGGLFTVQSARGHGTSIEFTIPIAEPQQEAATS